MRSNSRFFAAVTILTCLAWRSTLAQPSPNILDWLDLSSTTSSPPATCNTALSGQALSFPNSRAYLDGHNSSTGYTSCRARLPFEYMTHGFAFSVFHTFVYGRLSLEKGTVLEEVGIEVVYLDEQGKKTRTDGRVIEQAYGQRGSGYNGTFALSMHLKPLGTGNTELGVTSCPSAYSQPVIEVGVWAKLAVEDELVKAGSVNTHKQSFVEGLMVEFDVLWSRFHDEIYIQICNDLSHKPIINLSPRSVITGSTIVFFLLLSLAVYFFRFRKRSTRSTSRGDSHPGLSARPSNQHLISSPTSEATLQTPKRARTPLSLPFSNISKRGGQEQRGMPLSPSALDIVRERLEMESMGFGYQQDRRESRREAKSVVESLDWDWKRVYVYPFASSASSRGSVYSTMEGAGGLEEGEMGQGLGSYWEVSSGGGNGGTSTPGRSRR
ncbi:hypothetical protein B0T21DRAFT_411702 [Apiosordaria backusii]|uniref:Uncharacterized protein n=1 Tax=Apiosordaria backusii TaxID=314023 RepID=A0AA40BLQ4_9PEZI|nr:hypothetical protein B0T21DRAFT_411702 [Apiosordaria backusii]